MRGKWSKLAGLGVCLLAGALAAAAPAQDAARRVVSLNPSLTAILVAIGARPSLVGVDDFSAQAQSEVADLPRVGGLFNPSLEAVVALRPDLVVLVPSAEQRDFRTRLADLGIPRLELDPLRFDDVLETIEQLGRRVGREAAAGERVAALQQARRRAERATRGLARPRVLVVLQREPTFVIGSGNFVDDMLRSVGADNVASGLGSAYPRVGREWMIEAAPDVLLDASGDTRAGVSDATRYWSAWPSLPAVSQGRVVPLASGLATLPGPYLDRALQVLAESVHGDAVRERFEAAATTDAGS